MFWPIKVFIFIHCFSLRLFLVCNELSSTCDVFLDASPQPNNWLRTDPIEVHSGVKTVFVTIQYRTRNCSSPKLHCPVGPHQWQPWEKEYKTMLRSLPNETHSRWNPKTLLECHKSAKHVYSTCRCVYRTRKKIRHAHKFFQMATSLFVQPENP